MRTFRRFPHTLVVVLLHLSVLPLVAQQYGYRHYDVKDGLAGSVVYDLLQDKEGFIWMATETGLSRFDGTHFETFTSKNGLPDNNIIQIFEDRKGRIWIIPFKNSIYYYYKGKIYNQQNDPMLRQLKLFDFVSNLRENKYGDLVLADGTSVYLIDSTDQVKQIFSDPDNVKSISKIQVSASGSFYAIRDTSVYRIDSGKLVFVRPIVRLFHGSEQIILDDDMMFWFDFFGTLHVQSALYNLDYTFQLPPANTINRISDSIVCLNTSSGTLFFNFITKKTVKKFFTDKNTSNFLTDREGGYWFATLNDGVYRLTSSFVKNISKQTGKGQKLGVYDLQMCNGALWAASDLGYLQEIKKDSVKMISLGSLFTKMPRAGHISCMASKGNMLAAGWGQYVFIKRPGQDFVVWNMYSSVKQIHIRNEKELLIASSNDLYTIQVQARDRQRSAYTGSTTSYMDAHDGQRSVFTGRSTCFMNHHDTLYIGTLRGLHMIPPGGSPFYFGDTSAVLRNHISAIKETPDGVIWIATMGNGVIGIQNNRIKWHFTSNNGLASNITKCLTTDTNQVWVGTDKGLNKIDLHSNSATSTVYTTADGLGSDIINTVMKDGHMIYAGTPEGISWFDSREIIPPSICDLKIRGIIINGKKSELQSSYNLRAGENNISIDYVAISYKSAGDIVYKYRLSNADTAWKTTRQNTLEFLSLPPGEHDLQLYAVNKFGVASKNYTIHLSIDKPYWQTTLFILGCIALSIGATWFIISQRNSALRKKQEAKRQAERQLLQLEQKALRAQMNPHFIFNSLNSIQSYIIHEDIEGANMYLTQFARLIRQTLDNSFQSVIALTDEIRYLTTYLQLEQMRFGDRFEYSITVNDDIDPDQTFIPGMVLQPYIENAIKHGIQNNTNKPGQIDIRFILENGSTICYITDNGMGRKASQLFNLNRPAEYRSRGMQLTMERIELINKNLDDQITVNIHDLTDEQGTAAGTEVVIRFPVLNAEQ